MMGKLVASSSKNATHLLSLHVLLKSADKGHLHVQALCCCLSVWCLSILQGQSIGEESPVNSVDMHTGLKL